MRYRDVALAYGMQFRWEEDRLVYRHKQRGAPVEVSPAERDRAIERYTRLVNRIIVSGCVGFIAVLMVVLSTLPAHFAEAPFVLMAMGSFAICIWVLLNWAWDEPTRAWRSRKPIGEPLGRTGALVMLTEKLTWPQILIGIVVLPLAAVSLVAAPTPAIELPPRDASQWAMALLLAGAFLFHLLIVFYKFALHERDALKARRRQELDDARRLFDESP